MLSRAAERIYWAPRYLERAENTARLVNVYASLMLDLPKEVGIHWGQLIQITGNQRNYRKRFKSTGEMTVVKFMVADPENPGSIMSCLTMARENMRTSRDLIPNEGWEHVNELYLFAHKKLALKGQRKRLHQFLSDVVMRCQQITGLLAGTMSHGHAYQFLRLGRNLERADMSTRILDIGSANILASGGELGRLESRLWMHILQALSGYQMYRQNVPSRIRGRSAAEYLLKDTLFPRAVGHCLKEVEGCLELLPRNEKCLQQVRQTRDFVNNTDVLELYNSKQLDKLLDEIQVRLSDLDKTICETWFAPESK